MPGGVEDYYVALLQQYVLALEQFAVLMDRTFHIPWPLVLAVLYLPFLVILDIIIWWLRGTTWPVECGYPTLKQGPCQNRSFGEWNRCHQHRYVRLRRTDRQMILPQLRRWQTQIRGRVVEREDAYGRGFVLMKPERVAVLHYRGFVRPPRDAFGIMPGVARDRWRRLSAVARQVRLLGLRGLLLDPPKRSKLGVSPLAEHAIRATRVELVIVLAGLGLVGFSLLATAPVKPSLEFCAAVVFIGALAVGRSGIWNPGPDWRVRAMRDFIRFTGPVILAAVYGVVYAVALSDALTIVRASVGVLVLLIVGLGFSMVGRRKRR
jgi:hypothetical protein